MSDPLLTQLVQRAKMWLAGVTHGGRRDLYELFGYRRQVTQADFAARYIRQEVAKRIIDAPVLATWADPPDVTTDNDEFMTAWKDLLDEHPTIWQSLIRLDKLAGLGQYAVMVMGFDGQGDKRAEVTNTAGRKLLYLQPYAEMAAQVDSYITNQGSPDFGKPAIYTIQPGRFSPDTRVGSVGASYNKMQSREAFQIHSSRVLHVAENLLEDSICGRSRLENVTNVLDDIQKVAGGSAEFFWILANRGMQVDVDKEMELDETSAAELSKEIQEYHDDMRRFIRTRGVKISELGSQNIDPKSPFDVLIALLCAGTGFPKMILLGNTSGVTSSQQDRASWAERIMERNTEYSEPVVFRPFISKLVNAGVLPKPINLIVNWQEAFKLSPLERGQTSAQMARSAANLTKVITQVDTVGAPATPESKDPLTGKVIPGTPEKLPQEPLFTREEMRQIVGPGKRFPVFEKVQDSNQAQKGIKKPGTQPSKPTLKAVGE